MLCTEDQITGCKVFREISTIYTKMFSLYAYSLTRSQSNNQSINQSINQSVIQSSNRKSDLLSCIHSYSSGVARVIQGGVETYNATYPISRRVLRGKQAGREVLMSSPHVPLSNRPSGRSDLLFSDFNTEKIDRSA